MKLASPISGWDIRNAIVPALIAGAVCAAIALAAVLSQPPVFRAGIRILQTGGYSADEAEALAAEPQLSAAGVSLPAVSGYNLRPQDFLRGSAVEQPLAQPKEGGVLLLTILDTDRGRAEARVLAWAQALCSALVEKASAPDAGCYERGGITSEQTDNFLFWKILAAALLGTAVTSGGGLLQARWNAKEIAGMAKKEMVKSMDAAAQTLIRKFKSGKARVGVVGLGYVGLPLVDVFGHAGYTVVGIDVDQRKIDALNKGKSYIEDIPSSHVASLLRKRRPQSHDRFFPGRDSGRAFHLRSHPAAQDGRPGPFLHC